ncbi:MAG: glycosyltransferase family 4 protein, partial [Alphaproteobacteria bacterium]|nr:glycosyltransferase family 4 protein [Alphaproteobacteria bacterium]
AVYLATLCSALAMGFRYRKARIGGYRKVFVKEFLQAGMIANDILQHPEIVHLHGHFCHGATTVTWFASRLTGQPFSFTAHAKDIYQRKLNPRDLLPQKLAAARFVVTCTEANKTHLDQLAVEQGKVHRIYHGLDLERFTPAPRHRDPDRPVILAVGRFTKKKGFPSLVEALAHVRDRGRPFHCRLIGEPGDDSDEIERWVRTTGLIDRIEIMGAMPQDRLKAAYQAADLFVLPCLVVEDGDRDGIPNVLAEAMAMELPVISTAVSGIPELVEDGASGLLVPPSDAERLAEAMVALLDDPLRARRLGVAGRRTITQIFDSTVTTRDLDALFESAIQARLAEHPSRVSAVRAEA